MDVSQYVVDRAQALGIDPGIPLSILSIEDAPQDPTKVNPQSGAVGLFQVLPGYAGIGHGLTTQQLQDPKTNIDVALGSMQTSYQRGTQLGYQGLDLAEYTASHAGYDASTPLSDTSKTGYDTPGYVSLLQGTYPKVETMVQQYQKVGKSSGFGLPKVSLPDLNPSDIAKSAGDAAGTAAGNAVKGALGDVGSGIQSGVEAIGNDTATWVKDNGWKVALGLILILVLIGSAHKLIADMGINMPVVVPV